MTHDKEPVQGLPDAAQLAQVLQHPGIAAPTGNGAASVLEACLLQSLNRFSPAYHGDFPGWLEALNALPAAHPVRLTGSARVRLSTETPIDDRAVEPALRALMPWRKGPFDVFGLIIDTEWRSDWKWARVENSCDWSGCRVLDVGCGNGYFGWRLLDAGAALVIGIDPTLLFCMQHAAINRYAQSHRNWVLPLRLEELPLGDHQTLGFDRVLSMGVLYHRRDPQAHCRELFATTAPGGQLVLETLVVTRGDTLEPAKQKARYAQMRNVWNVAAISQVELWLQRAGFIDIDCMDVTATTIAEQRTTDWMRFQSLKDFLDPANPGRTVEGWPAPVRAVLRARRPA
ncbi:MAG: tRNA 5-methoxyuridine(34)/uridine 5-oxyacetic acid(34) synthase CmoB [Pseudomonadota bacterium]